MLNCMPGFKRTSTHMQGCWGDESSLMMLPNMTPEAVSSLASKGFQAVPQLCQAASVGAAKLRSTLTSVLDSSRGASEVMQVGAVTTQSICAAVGQLAKVHCRLASAHTDVQPSEWLSSSQP